MVIQTEDDFEHHNLMDYDTMHPYMQMMTRAGVTMLGHCVLT